MRADPENRKYLYQGTQMHPLSLLAPLLLRETNLSETQHEAMASDTQPPGSCLHLGLPAAKTWSN